MNENSVKLRLTILDCEVNSEQESDYDTAVDISHWSMSETKMTLETPYGLQLLLTERTESHTHSYLEPDFDVFERTGEVHYLTHRDDSNDSHKEKFAAFVMLPPEKQILSDHLSITQKSKVIDRKIVDEELEQIEYYNSIFQNAIPLKLNDEVLRSFFAEIGARRSGSVVLTVSEAVASEIRAHEKRLEIIRHANRQIDIENAGTAALFDVLGKFLRPTEIVAG